MVIIADLLFLFGAIVLFLFLPSILSKLSQVFFKRYIETANPFSESYKDDRIKEEMVSGKALLEGILKGT